MGETEFEIELETGKGRLGDGDRTKSRISSSLRRRHDPGVYSTAPRSHGVGSMGLGGMSAISHLSSTSVVPGCRSAPWCPRRTDLGISSPLGKAKRERQVGVVQGEAA